MRAVFERAKVILIEIIVAECKAQGIETMTPDELARLMEVER